MYLQTTKVTVTVKDAVFATLAAPRRYPVLQSGKNPGQEHCHAMLIAKALDFFSKNITFRHNYYFTYVQCVYVCKGSRKKVPPLMSRPLRP